VTQPRKPKPKAAPQWTDADIEQLTQVTPADQQKAASLWRERAPKSFKDLLDAETDAVSLE
jgi:hypothetical protein